MTLRRKLSFGLYLVNAVILFVFATRYLFADRLMSYHAETMGVARDGVPGEQMLVFVTLYRAVGAGMLAVGIAMAYQTGTTAAVPWPGPAVAVATLIIAHVLAGRRAGSA